ncbi:hypothetical protein AX17_006639 [Amanita inopinata Kibby_2008]|nr:hypothetical protein AX17_006639 [Amanita inopinata Kibby_2008]
MIVFKKVLSQLRRLYDPHTYEALSKQRIEASPVFQSPIFTLPTEVLQEIFLFAVESSFNQPPHHLVSSLSTAKVLSHICTRWRRIAFNYPPLWHSITDADLCNAKWLAGVLERSGSSSLRVRLCTLVDVEVDKKFISCVPMRRHLSRVTELYWDSDIGTFEMLQPLLHNWFSGLQKLNITIWDDTYGQLASGDFLLERKDDVDKGDYAGYVNAQHTPNLPYLPACKTALRYTGGYSSDLRTLSLVSCHIDLPCLALFKNLEKLEVSHPSTPADLMVHDWACVIRHMPKLRTLAVDGAIRDQRIHKLEELDSTIHILSDLQSQSQLMDLRINRCCPLSALLLHTASLNKPCSLQFTCATLEPSPEFGVLCAAFRFWFSRWPTEVENPYLYVSIEPNGIIVHNCITSFRHRMSHEKDWQETDPPTVQLALSWQSGDAGENGFDLIVPLLSVLFEGEERPGPLTQGCEELELSIGLFDYEDDSFKRIISRFLTRFDDVKRLRCIAGAGNALTSLSKGRCITPLLPPLDCIDFDYVDFEDDSGLEELVKWRSAMGLPVSRVAFDGCRGIGADIISCLEGAGVRVVLGKGTVLCKVPARKKWTSDQAKLLMQQWAEEAH